MHPLPFRDIGVQFLDLDVVGLPGVDLDRLEGGVAGYRIGGKPTNLNCHALSRWRDVDWIGEPPGGEIGQCATGHIRM